MEPLVIKKWTNVAVILLSRLAAQMARYTCLTTLPRHIRSTHCGSSITPTCCHGLSLEIGFKVKARLVLIALSP